MDFLGQLGPLPPFSLLLLLIHSLILGAEQHCKFSI